MSGLLYNILIVVFEGHKRRFGLFGLNWILSISHKW